jgi:hypothetical protein
MSPLALTAAGIGLALLGWGAFSAYFAWVAAHATFVAMKRMAKEQKRQGAVLDNVFRMVWTRVAQKPRPKAAAAPLDWSDDHRLTEVSGEHERALTDFDWRKPE